jgi:hypothetical protein
MHRVGLLVLLAAALLPATAGAQTRISVSKIGGAQGGGVRRQLVSSLCGVYECVSRSAAYTAGKFDPARARANRVAGVLAGKVVGGRLRLALYTTSDRPAQSWSLVLAGGTLDRATLEWIAFDINGTLSGSLTGPVPPQPAPPAPGGPQAKISLPGGAIPPTVPAVPPPPRRVVRTPIASPAARGRAGDVPLRAAIEAGLWVTRRRLKYEGAETAGSQPLLEFTAPAITSPLVRLEVYPGAWTGAPPLAAGLGVFAEYSHSVGFEVKTEGASSERHPVTLTDLGAGLLWRIRPGWGATAVTPAVAYRRLALETSSITGLPDARLSGFELGLDLEVPLTARIAMLAGGGYELWTDAEELVEGFFPGGSARGWTGELGASVAVIGPLSLKAVVEYAATSYSLDPDPTGTYRASGATDSYLGGRFAVRARF